MSSLVLVAEVEGPSHQVMREHNDDAIFVRVCLFCFSYLKEKERKGVRERERARERERERERKRERDRDRFFFAVTNSIA